MPARVASPAELDAYRAEADRFSAELLEEEFLHYAGLKDRLELEPIYERHAELASLERVRTIGAAAGDDRRAAELWRFACERYLCQETRPHEEQLAAAEADLTVDLDGQRIPFRMLYPALANEPDRE